MSGEGLIVEVYGGIVCLVKMWRAGREMIEEVLMMGREGGSLTYGM